MVPTPTPTLPTQVAPPAFALSARPAHELTGAHTLAFSVHPGPDGPSLGPGAEAAGEALSVDLLGVLEAERANGKAGEVLRVPVTSGPTTRLVLLVGVGEESADDFRRAGAALARAVRDREDVVTAIASAADDDALQAFVVGMMLGSFGFHWRSGGPEHRPVERVVLAGLPDEAELSGLLQRAIAIGGAGWRARMLATVPSNLKSPQWLAEQAQEVAAEHGLACRVWDEKELASDGFGGILGVGQASATPPRLIRLDYTPAGATRRTPTVVLVGKGITFDTGGLSIKPGEAMSTMKRDMTGGAIVIAAMAALETLGCRVKVVGLVPAAENAVGGNALRPGDVLRHYGGRTTEVTNTDAEGRLVMADALAYAVDTLSPAVLLDVATLTGAMKVALGQRTGGYFANDDALADMIFEAGRASGEPLWRFPLEPDYEPLLDSKVADADNAPGGPGAITAALFLQHFTGGLPWAHLDVASTGDSPSELFEWTTGPSGFGVRALLHWLSLPDPLDGVR